MGRSLDTHSSNLRIPALFSAFSPFPVSSFSLLSLNFLGSPLPKTNCLHPSPFLKGNQTKVALGCPGHSFPQLLLFAALTPSHKWATSVGFPAKQGGHGKKTTKERVPAGHQESLRAFTWGVPRGQVSTVSFVSREGLKLSAGSLSRH